MTSVQSAFVVLAMLFGVAGFSLSASHTAIPPLPRFKAARMQIAWLATASIAASVALLSWVARS
jgi:hypothetical protein